MATKYFCDICGKETEKHRNVYLDVACCHDIPCDICATCIVLNNVLSLVLLLKNIKEVRDEPLNSIKFINI